mmetsp:Transcript_72013/g.168635  ORF Transcript_72013/g.168635 Transcript_72013/m.168635 type:complete len:393 (-) Transcript_72013:254-1432(-)
MVHILLLLPQELGGYGVQRVRAQLLFLLDDREHVETDPAIDIDLDGLATTEIVDAFSAAVASKAPKFAEVEADPLRFCAIQQIRQVEVVDVVARDDIRVYVLQVLTEAQEHLLFCFEGMDVASCDFVASVQRPHRMVKRLLATLNLEVHGDLDNGAAFGFGEALALRVVTLDIEGHNSQGCNVKLLLWHQLGVVHVDFDLTGAHAVDARSAEALRGTNPSASHQLLVDHEAQGKGDVRLVGRARREVALLQSESGLDHPATRRHQTRHCYHDAQEAGVLVRALPAHDRRLLNHLDLPHIRVRLVPTTRRCQLRLQGTSKALHSFCTLQLLWALHEEVRLETMDVRKDTVALLCDPVHPQHRHGRIRIQWVRLVGEPAIRCLRVVVDVYLHEL